MRNLHFSVKNSGGASRTPGVLSERFNQNHMAMVGRPHPLEAILKKNYQTNFEKSTY